MTKQNKSLTIITIIAMMFLYAMIAFVTNLAAPVGKIWEESFAGNPHSGIYGMLGNFCNLGIFVPFVTTLLYNLSRMI